MNDGETDEYADEDDSFSNRLFVFLLLGVALVFIGIIVLVVVSSALGGSGSVGGVILIGPIPIIFGSGPNASWLIIISVILTVISLILFFVLNRRSRRFSG
ncbi:MAG: DUF131 domain-containing protein [Candidatus Bathyarchaeota archaeon]|nr:DUF131 domain-containing protein [Candidatus Bathyarchaeota archaeon]